MRDEDREHLGTTITRRGFLGLAGAVAGGAALNGGGNRLLVDHQHVTESESASSAVPFFGTHQSGIVTSPQRHSVFAAFDVVGERRADVVDLLRAWTSVAANLCAGRTAAPLTGATELVEPDSGDALGLGPARLTVNFGFGPSLFGVGTSDRFGLRAKWPMALVEAPPFAGDQLDVARSGGDLTVHACAEDPQVALHAVRQLARTGEGAARLRWSQSGFNETAASEGVPRNLFGFNDGIINPTSAKELDEFVWVGAGQDQQWMEGGTYVVVRRIRMLFDAWDAKTLGEQEKIIGRSKISGAPLGGRSAGSSLDLEARDANGEPTIPTDAHVRLAAAKENWGQMMLRRSYAYDDGASMNAWATLDAGLFFVAYQQNPRLAFIPIYARLARHDALRHFTVHTASAVAAIPPGVPTPGHFVGEGLFN